jgi:hypothetical protein
MTEQKTSLPSEEEVGQEVWSVITMPEYLGSGEEEKFALWNELFGEGNWRIAWQAENGILLSFEDIFNIYVCGYVAYFDSHPQEVRFLTQRYSYAYAKTPISKEEAFDRDALLQKQEIPNEFHHVALNIALEDVLKKSFKGKNPVQVQKRELKTPVESWPKGWRWHPGRIPCPYPQLIPNDVTFDGKWWDDGSIEDLYQSAMILEVKDSHLGEAC